MNATLWLACIVVLILLACLDCFLLWRLSFRFGPTNPVGSRDGLLFGFLSPFTLATQGGFALFAALYVVETEFEGLACRNQSNTSNAVSDSYGTGCHRRVDDETGDNGF